MDCLISIINSCAKFSLPILCLLFNSFFLFAQTDLQNGGIENWDYDDGGEYYEPGGYWATLNQLAKLSDTAPVTAFRETENVFSGQYAARLTTGIFFSLPVPGTLATGYFDSDLTDPLNALKLGVPFSERPDVFSGHFMYFPELQDSAVLYCELSRWTGTETELVGEAYLIVHDTVDEYTSFDIPFVYYTDAQPDTMQTIFTASAGGMDFVAAEGSTLYVDEVSLFYSIIGIPLMPEINHSIYPNPSSEILNLKLDENLKDGAIKIYNSAGTCVLNQKLSPTDFNTQIDIRILPSGSYFYTIENESLVVAGAKFNKLD